MTAKSDKVFAPLLEQIKYSWKEPRAGTTTVFFLLTPPVLSLLLRFVYLIIFTCFESSFGFFNRELGNDARTAGYLLCWFGIMYSFIQVC